MKTFKSILFLSLLSASLFGQTYFQGGIYSNTTWTKANAPYIITGDVVVFPDKTLTIEPGVEIRFSGYYFLEIRGILVAVGSDTDRIAFTSDAVNPVANDWYGVKIKNTQGAKASFEYCDFSYAECANEVECCWNGGPIYFKNCRFENNTYAMRGYTGYIINVDNCEFYNNTYCISQADKLVTNSIFIGNEYGLFATERINVYNSVFSDNQVAIYGGRGIVEGSVITNNGIGVSGFFEGFALMNNIIEQNDTAILISSYDGYYPPVKNNHICSNGLNVINTDDCNKDLTGNCWCTSDSTEIEDKLIDGYDNIYLGLFNYDIYEDSCLTVLKSVIKVSLTSVPEQNTDQNLTIFPNPANESISLEFTSLMRTIRICNSVGQEVFYSDVTGLETVSLNTTSWLPGVYYIRFTTANRDSFTRKLIVLH